MSVEAPGQPAAENPPEGSAFALNVDQILNPVTDDLPPAPPATAEQAPLETAAVPKEVVPEEAHNTPVAAEPVKVEQPGPPPLVITPKPQEDVVPKPPTTPETAPTAGPALLSSQEQPIEADHLSGGLKPHIGAAVSAPMFAIQESNNNHTEDAMETADEKGALYSNEVHREPVHAAPVTHPEPKLDQIEHRDILASADSETLEAKTDAAITWEEAAERRDAMPATLKGGELDTEQNLLREARETLHEAEEKIDRALHEEADRPTPETPQKMPWDTPGPSS